MGRIEKTKIINIALWIIIYYKNSIGIYFYNLKILKIFVNLTVSVFSFPNK